MHSKIKTTVCACGNTKAPRPDEFTFSFIKKIYDTINIDVLNCVQHFEEFGTLACGCNSSSFITLDPNIKDPTTLVDFRPISLIGCIYKIISKILSNKLKLVIKSIIGDV